MAIIDELEEVAKTYQPNTSIFKPDEDDTIMRYYGRVPRSMLAKYIPGKTKQQTGHRYHLIKKRDEGKKKAEPGKPADSLPVPDPADARTTGCEGCELAETGSVDLKECDKCPPLKKEAKTVPDEDPAKTGGCKVNKYGIPMDLAETDKKLYDRLWHRCKSHGIRYEEALVLKPAKRGRKLKAADTSKQSAQAIASSNDVKQSAWTPEEDAAIRDCPSEEAVLTHYMNKFPESERTAADVTQRWNEIVASKSPEQTAGAEA